MNGHYHSKEYSGREVPRTSKNYFRILLRFKALLFTCLFLLLGIKACFAQTVSLQVKNQPLEQVIKQLRAQTDYAIMAPSATLAKGKLVNVNLNKVTIDQALKEIFKNQPTTIDYEIKGKNIIIRQRSGTKEDNTKPKKDQPAKKSGSVVDQNGNPLAGVTISNPKGNLSTSTNQSGLFELSVHDGDQLLVSIMGYEPIEVMVSSGKIGQIILRPENIEIGVVDAVNTGYQTLPKERATGSFSTVSNELLNQQVGTDIISRLPNIANSVMMDQSGYNGQIMVRGLSTISGPKDPLIILDNFPYEGDLNNINPNIVENITILKDASASSIWGARAANGVIVITTKKGQVSHKINVRLNSSLTIGAKPNLGYIRQMSSTDMIDVEKELFSNGFYDSKLISSNRPVVSPVVDYLDQARKGAISLEEANDAIDALRNIDVRDQFNQYVYRPAVKQQYFVDANGGSNNFSWLSSVGYDHNKETLGENYDRLNLRFQNTYRPFKSLSLSTNLYYTQTTTASGRFGYSDIGYIFPYTRIADDNGIALPIARNWNMSYVSSFGDGKLMNWMYYPLDDWKHQTTKSNSSSILGASTLKYTILNGLSLNIDYQYQRETSNNSNLADIESYMARDYINSYTQIVNNVPIYIVPKGAILDKANFVSNTHNLRGQINFDRTYGRSNINAIAGTEIRSISNDGNQSRYYGYNPNNLTVGNVDFKTAYPNIITGGTSTIINGNLLNETDRRFVSQYANASYTYNDKYIFSGSLRRDASNLFGLKTNDQWNPFWSTGIAWKISKEKFYKFDQLPNLSIRGTIGYAGNIDPAMVSVNTIRFLPRASVYTGTPVALFQNYYNPQLRWETSKMFNIGVDFNSKSNRISGSIEYYQKKGINLFGTSPIDYTSGVDPYMLRNVAEMKGKGLDVELKTVNINKAFKWNTILNFSYFKDQIEEYNVERSLALFYISTDIPPVSGVKGHPVYSVYGYKWAGLDPANGEPQGYLDGKISKDYPAIIGEGTPVEDLDFFGSAIPTKFGSFINTVSYKAISLQVGLTYKFGYWFRRNSINYSDLYNNWRGHSDYANRWKMPGDENFTNIPSVDYLSNSSRDQFYEGASILVERGDHIRLQYINLAYNLSRTKYFNSVQFFVNANNLGIIWKANQAGIDPDFNINLNRFVTPANYSLGFRAHF